MVFALRGGGLHSTPMAASLFPPGTVALENHYRSIRGMDRSARARGIGPGPPRAGGARTGAPARVNLGSRSVAAARSFLVTARFWAFWCYPSPSPAAALTSFGCRTPRPRAGTSGSCPLVLAGGAEGWGTPSDL